MLVVEYLNMKKIDIDYEYDIHVEDDRILHIRRFKFETLSVKNVIKCLLEVGGTEYPNDEKFIDIHYSSYSKDDETYTVTINTETLSGRSRISK